MVVLVAVLGHPQQSYIVVSECGGPKHWLSGWFNVGRSTVG